MPISNELVLGIIGTITGIVSFILYLTQVKKNKAIVKLEKYGTSGYEEVKNGSYNHKDKKHLYVGLLIKNKGTLPTTIENIYLTINKFLKDGKDITLEYKQEEIKFDGGTISASTTITPIPFGLSGNSSQLFTIRTTLVGQELESIKKQGKTICDIYVKHTFGKEHLRKIIG